MSKIEELKCCSELIEDWKLVQLEDIKGFTNRSMKVGTCPKCGDVAVVLMYLNTKNNIFYANLYNGIEAVKLLYKENKRVIKNNDVNGWTMRRWIYGINTEIKNKNGKVTKIRQYSTDFKTGAKKLEKEILTV